jgi:hypothetical protein
MVSAIRERVTVQAGGRIEIPSSEFPPGAQAEVIVVLEAAPSRNSLASMIGKGKGAFATPQEADRFIRKERSEWGFATS